MATFLPLMWSGNLEVVQSFWSAPAVKQRAKEGGAKANLQEMPSDPCQGSSLNPPADISHFTSGKQFQRSQVTFPNSQIRTCIVRGRARMWTPLPDSLNSCASLTPWNYIFGDLASRLILLPSWNTILSNIFSTPFVHSWASLVFSTPHTGTQVDSRSRPLTPSFFPA